MTQAYPLQWPQARRRTHPAYRRNGNFKKDGRDITVRDAMDRLRRELAMLGVNGFVLSSNLIRNQDGSPRSGQPEPADPGVALYFQMDGKPHCMPCDTFSRAAQNIAGIAGHIDATRTIERYGVATVAEMFTGFVALPAPGAKKPWRQIMGLPTDWRGTTDDVRAQYRAVAKNLHPDQAGGDTDAMAELNAARDDALREIGA